MKRITFMTALCIMLWAGAGSIGFAQGEKASSFTDIQSHWAEKTIEEMVQRGILDGYPDGTFRPQEPVKVDQFIKMLVLSYTDLHQNGDRSWNPAFLQSLSAENQAILKQDYRYFDFKASTAGYWAKPYIDISSDLHLLNRSRYNDFQADMTRENVAEILYYTLQETEFLEDSQFSQGVAQSYGDLRSASEREQKFIAESLVKGIMQGYPSGFFGVGQTVTRAESLVLLERLTDKSKRIAVKVSPEKLERTVPTQGGGKKIVVFPDQRMWDAYEALVAAGQLRGSNHDLFETTLRLFKDQEEKELVFARKAGASEEAALWLDPQYNTYGITIHLRQGTLARNQEAVQLFANGLFGYHASSFHQLFTEICTNVEAGKRTDSSAIIIGDNNVNIQVDAAAKTVIFSIAKKK
ncbi:S-layer homology domain-containing protein [Paenibacillus oenotherae]|uniref:S-layer homology domain-containing protein n=1 Tax=Paenibacillus oenotherae TaxID=1435645 RepID=A0ABS7D7Y7_9BACL|nr:S-layer homology domain-containing protein [Paenibacillus oenotherae]MBW7476057.1 S-layer homology domain-containing protein [Paenibacillus oenotherae]